MTTALLLALGVLFVLRAYGRERDLAEQEAVATARAGAVLVDRFIDDRLALLRAIAANPVVKRNETQLVRAYFESFHSESDVFRGGVALLGVDGTVRVSSSVLRASGPVSFEALRGVVAQVASSRTANIGPALVGRGGTVIVPLSVQVTDPLGRVQGVLVGMMLPETSAFSGSLSGLSPDLMIADSTGRIVLGKPMPAPDVRSAGDQRLVRRLFAMQAGFLDSDVDLQGRRGRAVAFATTRTTDWVVLINRTDDAVFGASRRRGAQELAALVVGALIALAAGSLVARRLDRAAQVVRKVREHERTLEQMASVLAATNTVDRMAEVAVEVAFEALPSIAAAVIDPGSADRRAGLSALPRDEEARTLSSAAGLRRALETQRPVWGDGHPEHDLLLPLSENLVLAVRLSRTLSDRERSFATALADRVSSAMTRARLFENLQLAERSLRAQAGLLEATANGTADLIFAKDLEGRFVMVNRATASALGTTVSEALGRREEDFVAADPEAFAAEERVRLTGEPESGERRMELDDDERLFVFNTAPLREDEVIGTVTVGHDITERNRIELARVQALSRESDIRRRVQLLQSITAALALAATSREIAEAIVRETERGFDVDVVSVLLADDDTLEPLAGQGFGADMRVPIDAALPQAAAFRAGTTLTVESLQPDVFAAYPGLTEASTAWSSAIFVPVCPDRVPKGVLVWASYRPRSFDEEFVQLAEAVAGQAALAFERARLFEAERRIAVELQRSMLPSGFPHAEGAQFSVRYESGAEHLAVGGDWYEAIVLPTHRVAMIVGDVVGRGLHAAAAMAQLRSASAALTAVTRDPGSLLERLEAFASGTEGGQFATVAVCVLDPITGLLRYGCAAHPYPLILYPGGEAAFLEDGRSPPLCASDGGRRPEGAVRLPPGSTVLLYTDGLVERRGASLESELERLRDSVSGYAGLPIEQLSDAVVTDMIGNEPITDDVALLAATIAGPSGTALSRRVVGTPDQVPVLRHALRSWLEPLDLAPDVRDDVILAVGEAVANAVEHAYAGQAPGPIDLFGWTADGGNAICLEVADHGVWRHDAPDVDRGRGLAIMRSLLDTVDVVHTRDGTSISMTRLPSAAT